MDVNRFFYRVFRVNDAGDPLGYLGMAFPIAPDGGLITCRHVVDVGLDEGEHVAVHDAERGRMHRQSPAPFPNDSGLDIAYLPDALGRSKPEYFPILDPAAIMIGEDVYSFGSFLQSTAGAQPEFGYFKGNIVNAPTPPERSHLQLTLSYPVIEGLSGSPVLTYHNGPKVVGVAFGSVSTRVLASEIVDYSDAGGHVSETVNRIVEFGLAYQPGALLPYLRELGVAFTVSSERVPVPGLS